MHFLTCLKSKTMRNLLNLALVLLSTFLLFGCEKDELSTPNYPDQEYGITGGTRPGKPTSTAGNNLSFPVIWAEGVEKTLPGTDGMVPALNGDFWWWWGIEGVDRLGFSLVINHADTELIAFRFYQIRNYCEGGIDIRQVVGYTKQVGGQAAICMLDPHNFRSWRYHHENWDFLGVL